MQNVNYVLFIAKKYEYKTVPSHYVYHVFCAHETTDFSIYI